MRRLLVALSCALLAACSSGGGDAAPSPSGTTAPTAGPVEPTQAVRASAGAARAAAGATYTYVLAGQAPKGPVDRISGVGRIDLATDTAATRGDFGLASRGQQFDVVTRGSQYWLMVPPRHRTGYVKTPWVSTTLRVARLGMSTLGHPGTYVDALRAAADMTVAGTETVRGVATTHYKGRLDVARFIEGLPPEMRDATRAAFRGVTDVHLEVWLDPAGRPWRVRTRATAGGTAIESAFDVTKYGEVAAVVVPDRVTALPRIEAVFAAVGIGGGG